MGNIRRFAENEDVSRHSKMIVFLTDGKPTVGKTSAKDILNKVKEMNQQRVAVHTIGFGTLVDMNFLNKLSGENNGISRRVFESLDAAVQIHNFIDEVVTPVMKNVTINFESDRSFTERLWSYLRIKELLNQANLADNETMKEDLKQQALNMSLSYNFVTPLTSLIALETDD